MPVVSAWRRSGWAWLAAGLDVRSFKSENHPGRPIDVESTRSDRSSRRHVRHVRG
jgi:hypothetical protein